MILSCPCSLTHSRSVSIQGPVVSFNLLDAVGAHTGYREVARLAAIHGIHLRAGCFCNVGACATFLGLTPADVKRHYKEGGHVCGDNISVVDGQPTGAVRVSFGWMSTPKDVDTLLSFVQRRFIDTPTPPETVTVSPPVTSGLQLAELWVFPIKSCRGIHAEVREREMGVLHCIRLFGLVTCGVVCAGVAAGSKWSVVGSCMACRGRSRQAGQRKAVPMHDVVVPYGGSGCQHAPATVAWRGWVGGWVWLYG
jgi:hypothetical protein